MKPFETLLEAKNRHKIVMWLCILFGGFTIILFGLDLYSAVWLGGSFLATQTDTRVIDSNTSFARDINHDFPPQRELRNPLMQITSPTSVLTLASGLISLAAGFTIWGITREKEIRKIRQETADYLLLPDEKKVIDVLKRNDYALAQSRIVKDSGLTKVQVHRVIKKLEAKGLIEKHEYGLTNKIVLKKELFE